MLQVEMTASVRKVTGKGAMRQLRMKGFTPAVVYGSGSEGMAIQLETQPLFQKLVKVYRKNVIVTLNLDDGSSKHVLIKDVQTDPIRDTLIHADFMEIDITKPRVFEVPIKFLGNAKGCDLGGVLYIPTGTLAIEAVPLDIPDEFTVDVSPLNIGQSIKVRTIPIADNLTLLTDPKSICVSVVTSKIELDDEDEDEVEVEEGVGAEGAEAVEAASEE